MRKSFRILALVIATHFLFQTIVAQSTDKWLGDYAAVKRFMAEAYANLDWAIDTKKVDLIALDRKTLDALRTATSDGEARSVLERFLAAFDDGHLKLTENGENSHIFGNKLQSILPDAPADKVCNDLGYKFRFHRFSLPFDKSPGFKQISTNKDQFPSAIFTLENGKKYGVLRIGLFGADGFLGNCIEAWNEFRAGSKAPCDKDCIDKFPNLVDNRLTRKLAEQVKILQEQKIDFLIVDIGGNGGGRNWVEAAARTISPKPLHSTRSGFIRHSLWAGILEEDLRNVLDDLLRKDLSPQQVNYLKTAKSKLEQLINEARTSCDKSYVWTAKKPATVCDRLNTTPAFSAGVFDYLTPDEVHNIKNLKSRGILFMPSEFEYDESMFTGKLIVVIDGKTASAAEHFASLMQQNKSAQVVGELTLGAGCGYVNGGTNYILPYSKLRLRMPDCVRFRGDGVNEVSGIMPDVTLWEAKDGKQERLEKLLNYLSK